MGRHSAPDDADDDEVGAQPQTLALAADPGLAEVIESRGRHERADAGLDEPAPGHPSELDETQRISIISDEPPDDTEPPFPLDLHTITEPQPPELEPHDPAEAPIDKRAAKAERKAEREAERQARKSAGRDEKSARESETRADLRLLRQNPAVRAQAIGAVIASFLVYTIVMIVLGRTSDYLLWLWLPIVAAGVLVGLVLDLAHRRVAKQAKQATPSTQATPTNQEQQPGEPGEPDTDTGQLPR